MRAFYSTFLKVNQFPSPVKPPSLLSQQPYPTVLITKEELGHNFVGTNEGLLETNENADTLYLERVAVVRVGGQCLSEIGLRTRRVLQFPIGV